LVGIEHRTEAGFGDAEWFDRDGDEEAHETVRIPAGR
jgi:hypothetical protein